MSDCSTQAMLPKEQPSDEQFDKYVIHLEIKDPNEYIHQVSEVEINDCKFINAQRYQQLEKVALLMLDTMTDFCAHAYAEEAKVRLEALRVNVDD